MWEVKVKFLMLTCDGKSVYINSNTISRLFHSGNGTQIEFIYPRKNPPDAHITVEESPAAILKMLPEEEQPDWDVPQDIP